MSGPFLVWLAVGLVTTAAIGAMLVALVRHAILLGRTVTRLQQEIQPIAAEIAAESKRVSSRVSQVAAERPLGRS